MADVDRETSKKVIHIVMAPCKCKVAGCKACGSRCRRCACACDGTLPQIALSRKPGGQKGQKRKRRVPTQTSNNTNNITTNSENNIEKARLLNSKSSHPKHSKPIAKNDIDEDTHEASETDTEDDMIQPINTNNITHNNIKGKKEKENEDIEDDQQHQQQQQQQGKRKPLQKRRKKKTENENEHEQQEEKQQKQQRQKNHPEAKSETKTDKEKEEKLELDEEERQKHNKTETQIEKQKEKDKKLEGREDEENPHLLKTVRDISKAFGFTTSQLKKFPSAEARNSGSVKKPSSNWSSLVHRTLSATTHLSQILYPGGQEQLLHEVGLKLIKQQVSATDDDINENKKGKEKEKDKELQDLKQLDKQKNEFLNLIQCMVNIFKNSPKQSTQYKVIRALMVKGLSSSTIENEIKQKYGTSLGGGSSISAAYDDFNQMKKGNVINFPQPKHNQLRQNEPHQQSNESLKNNNHNDNNISISNNSRSISTSSDGLHKNVENWVINLVKSQPSLPPNEVIRKARETFTGGILEGNVVEVLLKHRIQGVKRCIRKKERREGLKREMATAVVNESTNDNMNMNTNTTSINSNSNISLETSIPTLDINLINNSIDFANSNTNLHNHTTLNYNQNSDAHQLIQHQYKQQQQQTSSLAAQNANPSPADKAMNEDNRNGSSSNNPNITPETGNTKTLMDGIDYSMNQLPPSNRDILQQNPSVPTPTNVNVKPRPHEVITQNKNQSHSQAATQQKQELERKNGIEQREDVHQHHEEQQQKQQKQQNETSFVVETCAFSDKMRSTDNNDIKLQDQQKDYLSNRLDSHAPTGFYNSSAKNNNECVNRTASSANDDILGSDIQKDSVTCRPSSDRIESPLQTASSIEPT